MFTKLFYLKYVFVFVHSGLDINRMQVGMVRQQQLLQLVIVVKMIVVEITKKAPSISIIIVFVM